MKLLLLYTSFIRIILVLVWLFLFSILIMHRKYSLYLSHQQLDKELLKSNLSIQLAMAA